MFARVCHHSHKLSVNFGCLTQNFRPTFVLGHLLPFLEFFDPLSPPIAKLISGQVTNRTLLTITVLQRLNTCVERLITIVQTLSTGRETDGETD